MTVSRQTYGNLSFVTHPSTIFYLSCHYHIEPFSDPPACSPVPSTFYFNRSSSERQEHHFRLIRFLSIYILSIIPRDTDGTLSSITL